MDSKIIARNAKDTLQWFGMVGMDGQEVAYVKQECPRWVDHMVSDCMGSQGYTEETYNPIMGALKTIVACDGDLSAAKQRLESVKGQLDVLTAVAAVLIRRGH